MKLFQFFAASTFAQTLDNSFWSCDFALDYYALEAQNSPLPEGARFISKGTLASQDSVNGFMTSEVRDMVCGASQNLLGTSRSETERAETPSWFWNEEQEDGSLLVRFCCEPSKYLEPIDELNRIFALGGKAGNEQLDGLLKRMKTDYRKKVAKGYAETDAIHFPFNSFENECDHLAEFAQVLKNWSSVHNYNYTNQNGRRHAKFVREIDEAFLQFEC